MNITKGIACKGVITQKSNYNSINLNPKLTNFFIYKKNINILIRQTIQKINVKIL